MKKSTSGKLIGYLLAILFTCKYNNVRAQNSRGYSSSFYGKKIAPVSNILFLYRREYYTKKSFEYMKKALEDSALLHNVKFDFAVTGSMEADSLQNLASFTCRINVNEVMQNYAYSLSTNVGEFRKSHLRGSGFRKFSILGFTDNPDIPVWKCFCDIEVNSRKMPEEAAVKCLFSKLLADGIIK